MKNYRHLEDNFRQSMLMSGGTPEILVRGSITWFFWALTIVTIVTIIRSDLRKRRVEIIGHGNEE